MRKINKLFGILLAALFVIMQPLSAYAAAADNLNEGTYSISAKLSCYVNAMGGVEFGAPLLKSAQLIVDKKGNKKIKLHLTKASVTIYSVTCDTFVDASPAGTAQESDSNVPNGTIGYYNKNGKLKTNGVTHTMSSDTALNSQNEAVKYVESITFPVDSVADTYKLTLFINSNVMGMQFDPATLTVDWNSVQATGTNSNSKNKSTTKASSASGTTSKAKQSTDTSNKNSSNTDNTNSANAGSTAKAQTTNSAVQSEISAASQAVNDNGSAEVSDNVIKKDGLDIHYVNGDSKLDLGADTYSDIPFYAYLNMPVLIGMAIFAGVLVIAGIVLILVSKKQKEKKSNE
ncbi:MAG: hypothetical protein NC397_08155 [Clostridium sp.]|nr:hypothetical protein [Clostridium sp.]